MADFLPSRKIWNLTDIRPHLSRGVAWVQLAKWGRIDRLLRMVGRIGFAVLMAVAGLVGVAHAAGATTRPSTRTGDVRTHEHFRSAILGNERRLWVYLPPGYEAS